MKPYEKPKLLLTVFNCNDVITDSTHDNVAQDKSWISFTDFIGIE